MYLASCFDEQKCSCQRPSIHLLQFTVSAMTFCSRLILTVAYQLTHQQNLVIPIAYSSSIEYLFEPRSSRGAGRVWLLKLGSVSES